MHLSTNASFCFKPAALLTGSDQSDQTLLGFSTSCNGDGESEDAQEEDHNADEDEEDQHQSEQEECAEETLDPYHSDDESWADGVSSGVSLSDCDSPAMGLSAFDGPLRDVHDSGDDRCTLLWSPCCAYVPSCGCMHKCNLDNGHPVVSDV